MDQWQSRLRYVDADDISAPQIDFDGLKVRNEAMETLGSVDGFIVDSVSTRPYYVVVDSGGWFKSRDFLVPIGHARIDDDRDALVLDIAREQIERFPRFDRSAFEQLSEDDARRMNDAICEACDDMHATYRPTDPLSAAWSRPAYTQPEWWASVSPIGMPVTDLGPSQTNFIPAEDYPASKVPRALGEVQAEQMIAREKTQARAPRREKTSDDVIARASDTSPHRDGRAQPGDVLGLETGGEETHIGDTPEDENKRRLAAQRANAKRRDK